MLVRTLIAGLLVAGMVSLANAQPSTSESRSPVYTAEELRSFVDTTLALTALNAEYEARFARARTPEELQALHQQLTAQTVEAVSRKGLTLERYNAMADAVTTDERVAEQLNRYLQSQPR